MADQASMNTDYSNWGVVTDQADKPDNMVSSDLSGIDALRALAAEDPANYGSVLKKYEESQAQPTPAQPQKSLPKTVGDYFSNLSAYDMGKAILQSGANAVTLPGGYLTNEWPHFNKEGKWVVTPPPSLDTQEGVEAVTDAALNITNIGPGTAFRSVANVPAQKEVAKAIAEDIRQNKARGLSPDVSPSGKRVPLPGATAHELQVLSDEGIPVSAYDLSGGPGLQKLVEDAASKSPKAHEAAIALQRMMTERTTNANSYLGNVIDNIAGKNLSFGDEFAAAIKNISDTNDPNYTAVFSMPGNSAIMSPELQRMATQSPTIKKIVDKYNVAYLDKGQTPPLYYDRAGNLVFDQANPPPLEYWDNIYRVLRDDANSLFENGENTLGKNVRSLAEDLRNNLDNLAEKMPNGGSSYKMIRDEASEVFGGRNALESGYKYVTMSPFVEATKAAKALNQIASNPNQFRQFQTGILSKIKEDALKNPNKFASYFDGSNPAVSDKLRTVLGDEVYDHLTNHALMQKVLSQNKVFNLDAATGKIVGSRHPLIETAIGTAAGFAPFTEQGQQIIQAAVQKGGPYAVGLAGGVIAAAAARRIVSSFKSAYEKKKAEEIINILNSRDPSKFSAIEKANPSIFFNIVRTLGIPTAIAEKSAFSSGELTTPAREDAYSDWGVIETPKASGGRVARKAGGRIKTNPISAEVKRVRTLLSQKTANMLSLPDDAIATALHIAKRT